MSDLNTSDRDASRAIRSWLHEDKHEDASRIAAAVLDRVETTRQRRATWWPSRRTPAMNKILGFATAAVVVAAVALVGINRLPTAGSGVGGPQSTPSPSLTAAPTATPQPTLARLPQSGPIDAGTYRWTDGRSSISLTIPSGWDAGFEGNDIRKHRDQASELGLEIYPADIHVYADACDTEGPPPVTGPSADDLVAALLAQRNSETTGPTDITVAGRPGVTVVVSAPKSLDQAGCTDGLVRIWSNLARTGNYLVVGTEPMPLSIVGTPSGRLVLVPMIQPTASAADKAELQAIVDSIQIQATP